MRVYIGADRRLQTAYEVAATTARAFGCDVMPLREDMLRTAGILTRPVDTRGGMFDLNSSASQSTEFAVARFAVPLLQHEGWCLFADSDVVFMRDPHELQDVADPTKAVMVVKHPPLAVSGQKMDGQTQASYPRKAWSSIIWWNCGHPANRRLNVTTLNQWPGRDLHAFGWLHDDEIGELDPRWNWLVGLQPKPDRPAVAHYTLGTPDLPGYENSEHADIWHTAREAA